jgi:hypothetical protein
VIRAARAILVALALAGCGSAERTAPGVAPRFPLALAGACARDAATSELPVLCPPVTQAGGPLRVIHDDLDPDPCIYLINLETTGGERGPAPFHVLLGGMCGAMPLGRPGGEFPPEPPASLRLVGSPPVLSGAAPRIVRPRVLRRVDVRGLPGVLLQAKPFPEGAYQGGHYALVWNEHGAAYTVSLHWPSGQLGRPPSAEQIAALERIARSLRAVAGG